MLTLRARATSVATDSADTGFDERGNRGRTAHCQLVMVEDRSYTLSVLSALKQPAEVSAPRQVEFTRLGKASRPRIHISLSYRDHSTALGRPPGNGSVTIVEDP